MIGAIIFGMSDHKNNYAFIDSQNVNLGIRNLGWRLDWKKFRVYLKEKYHVGNAYTFLGRVPEYEGLYTALQEFGYIVVLKNVARTKDGKVKGNVDVDLTVKVWREEHNFDRAVLVTSDGDFAALVEFLRQKDKLLRVLSPSPKGCSALLKKAAAQQIDFLVDQRRHLEYI